MLINDKTGKTFYPELEIRQGEPISPYFIICAEYMDAYIKFMSTERNSGIGIKKNKDCPSISYLMFDDASYLLYSDSKGNKNN